MRRVAYEVVKSRDEENAITICGTGLSEYNRSRISRFCEKVKRDRAGADLKNAHRRCPEFSMVRGRVWVCAERWRDVVVGECDLCARRGVRGSREEAMRRRVGFGWVR